MRTYEVDVSYRVNSKIGVRGGIGLCGSGGDSDVTLGGIASTRLWRSVDRKIGVRGQFGVNYVNFSSGNEIALPLQASVRYTLSDKLSLWGAGTIEFERQSFGDQSDTGSALYFAGGVKVSPTKFRIQGGLA